MAGEVPHDTNAVPEGVAVAVIMDGNGRWATRNNVAVTEGHREGGETLHRIVEGALDLNVSEITVYAFSTENWSRSPLEVAGIMQLFGDMLDSKLPELHRKGVRMRFLGRRSEIPEYLQEKMRNAETHTQNNAEMTLAIAFNYGGKAEIVDAVKSLIIDENAGVDDITEDAIRSALYLPDMRDPDLIIRTAGESRTSNFMVWQGAYSELVFSSVLWPDFTTEDLRDALLEYGRRTRNFGGRVTTGAAR